MRLHPEVHRGVGAPRAPRLGEARGVARCDRSAASRQRPPQAEVAGGEGVRLAARTHRHVLGRPLADAGDLAELARERLRAARRLEIELTRCDGARQRLQRCRARPRQSDRGEVGPRERLGSREQVAQAGAARGAERLAEARGQAARQRAGAAHRHLLAEHGPHRHLEGLPGARHAQPGPPRQRRGQRRMARQLRGDRDRIGIEVEQAPRHRHDLMYPVEGRQPHREQELAGAGHRPHLERTEPGAEADRAPVRLALDLFDAGCGAQRQEVEQRAPVERRAERQPQRQGRLRRRRGAARAQRRRGGGEAGAHRVVELPHAREARREGDLGQRQVALVEQAARQVGAARPRDRSGCHTEMSRKQPRQMARPDAEPRREGLEIVVVEGARRDQPQRARHQRRAARPGRRARGGLGSAAPACPEAGALRGRRAREESHVLAARSARRADRPAVDAGGHDAGEEAPVEAAVARQQRPVAAVGVERGVGHDRTLPQRRRPGSQDSDVTGRQLASAPRARRRGHRGRGSARRRGV